MDYQGCGKFPSNSCSSNEDFLCEIDKKTIASRKLHILFRMEKALLEDDTESFGNYCNELSKIYDSDSLLSHDDETNPFKNTNLIILACKFEKLKILNYIFSNFQMISKIFSNGENHLSPDFQDETGHNAFYYSIRSGNIELFQNLIDGWPNNYFLQNLEILNENLSQAYQELKLKNVLLSQEIEILVQEKLVDIRFFSNSNRKDERNKNSLYNMKERIMLLVENIQSLNLNGEVDDRFLFLAKKVAQNIHILKQQLKFTYNILPWEEVEFCVLAFISSFTKVQSINLQYQVILTKEKIVQYLQHFSLKLQLMISNIDNISQQLNVVPKTNRDDNISNIMINSPQFKELYQDYRQIRDIHSLERMSNYIKLALSVDSAQKEGQLVIIRSLQVIGEYFKNTLESPKLSTFTSERLLMSLDSDIRKIIIDLRNSLSHSYSLSKRISIEESSNIDFFRKVQSDMTKIGIVINDIMYKDKIAMIKILLQKLCDSENLAVVEHISMISKNCQLDKELPIPDVIINVYEVLEKLMNNLRKSISQPNEYERHILDQINEIIRGEKCKIVDMRELYLTSTASMKILFCLLTNSHINQNNLKSFKYMAFFILNILKSNEPKVTNLNQISELALSLQSRNRSESQSKNSTEMDEIIYSIFHFVKYEANNLKWINKLRNKLEGKQCESQDQQILINSVRKSYGNHLNRKLCELKGFLKMHSMNDSVKYSFEDGKKLQVVLEMLVLDILSILGSHTNRLENNIHYLDDKASILVGKSLRNHLAHDNALIEILESDPSVVLISNARKLAAENVLQSKRKIGRIFEENISNVKATYIRELNMINNQEKMFVALKEGQFEDLKKCILAGADIFGRNLKSWSVFHFSAMSQNLDGIKYLLSQNVDINMKNNNKQTSLHIAALYGNYDVVDFILENNYLNVNDLDDTDRTPLHYAAYYGHEKTIETLLKYNAKTNIKDSLGYLPLHYATKFNHIEIIKILIEKDPKSEHVTALHEYSLLHIASEEGHLDIVNFLLQRKADIDSKSDRKVTALQLAAFNGHLEVLNVLISKGAKINAENIDGCTPLHNAIENGHEKIVDVLLKHKAEPNVREKLFSSTPLHYAANNGHENIVNELLKYGADPNPKTTEDKTPLILAVTKGHLKITEILLKAGVSIKDKNNATSIYLAIRGGYYEVIKLLIKYGFDIHIKGGKCFNGMSPIHMAALEGQTNILKLLLENKFKTDVRDVHGNTPLHLASYNGNKITIEMLLKENLEIDARNGNGMMPIHVAVQRGNIDAVEVLIKHNAGINVKCANRFTPLHLAVLFDHTEIVDLLIKKNADVNLRAQFGMTALHIAADRGCIEIARILIARGAIIDVINDSDKTPLTHAVIANEKEFVKLLIENGADVNFDKGLTLINAVQNKHKGIINLLLKNNARIDNEFFGMNPLLFLAIRNNDEDTVYTLIKRGVDVNRDAQGVTPLFTAVELQRESIVEILLKNGAKVNRKTTAGTAPLHAACATDDCSNIVEILLKYKADVNLKDYDGRKAFHLAVSRNYLESVKILFQCAKINVNEVSNGFTAVHIAAQEGHVEMLKLLVKKGGDIYATNKSGTKPIHIAAREGYKNVVEFFLNKGVNIDEPGRYGQTPLHYASATGQLEVSKYLLYKGANINAKDYIGVTIMDIAAAMTSVNYVKFLLDNGAFYNGMNMLKMNYAKDTRIIHLLKSTKRLFDAVKQNDAVNVKNSICEGAFVNAKNKDDVTPLYFAAWKGYGDIVDILLENNADPNLKGKNGLRPLHYASKYSHLNIVKSLLTKGATYNVISDSGKTPVSFTSYADIITLYKLIDESFRKIENGNNSVIYDLEKIKDVDVLRAIFGTVNVDNKSLITLAKINDFENISKLMNISVRCLSKTNRTGESVDYMNNSIFLADICIFQEKYTDALKLYESIFEERNKIFGPNNSETLDTEYKISQILFKQRRYKDAAKLLEEIYSKRVKISGENDPSTLNVKSSLALILYYQGRCEEALKIYREVYDKQKDILKFDNSDLLDTQAHLAIVLMDLKNYDEALELNQKVYSIRAQLLGSQDPRILSLQNNTAMILSRQGKYAESLKIYKEVFETRLKVLGPSHSDTLRAQQNIIGVHTMQGNISEALELYQDLFKIQKESLGSDHLDTLNSQYMIAKLLLKQGTVVVAMKMLNDCLLKKKAILGAQHVDVIEIETTLNSKKSFSKGEGVFDFSNEIIFDDNEKAITFIKNGDAEGVKNLLKNGLNLKYADDNGCTFLHIAIQSGHIEIVNLLLKNEASVTKTTKKGNTPLHTAVLKDRKDIAEILLKNVNVDELIDLVNAKTTGTGTTSLHVAAKSGSIELVKLLLTNSAIYCIKNKEGKTPIDLSKNYDVINFLKTVHELFQGVEKGDEKIIIKLKNMENDKLRAILNARNNESKSIFQIAAMKKYKNLANELLVTLRMANKK